MNKKIFTHQMKLATIYGADWSIICTPHNELHPTDTALTERFDHFEVCSPKFLCLPEIR